MSHVDTITVGVTAQLPENLTSSTVCEDIEHAVLELVQSLEIPVKPIVEILPGNGRLLIGRHAIWLGLDTEETRYSVQGIQGIWRLAGEFITEEVTRHLYRNWVGGNIRLNCAQIVPVKVKILKGKIFYQGQIFPNGSKRNQKLVEKDE